MQRRSQEEILPKKPRVPKVAEILPDVKIIKKKKSKATLETNKDPSAKSPAKGSKMEKEKSASPKAEKRFNSKLWKKPYSPKKKN